METIDYYEYFSKHCHFFWKDTSRNLAEDILSNKPVGSFLLRSSEEGYEDCVFAISYVYGNQNRSMIEHGHLLFFPNCFPNWESCVGDHWVCVNTIGLDHGLDIIVGGKCDVLSQAINRPDCNSTMSSLRSLAIQQP